jgi:hypothetical protein
MNAQEISSLRRGILWRQKKSTATASRQRLNHAIADKLVCAEWNRSVFLRELQGDASGDSVWDAAHVRTKSGDVEMTNAQRPVRPAHASEA